MSTDLRQRRELRYQSPTEPVHIVGIGWQFEWYPSVIEQVIQYYNAGDSLLQIAKKVDSEPRDVLLLLIELAEKGKIEEREGWVWGRKRN